MNGERVGTWSLPARGPQQFTYDESWLDSSQFRPLSLSLPAGLLHRLHEGGFANPRPVRCEVLTSWPIWQNLACAMQALLALISMQSRQACR